MNDDYSEDGYSRVRQIPIQIEGRDNQMPNTRYTQTRNTHSNTGNDGYGHQNQQQYQQNHQHHYQQQYAEHQTSPPNVSSVNIDYRPSPSGRPNNQTNPTNSNSGNINKAKGDGQRPHSVNASHQDSEPKLVNSPEPIPLPPPQASQFNSEAAKAAAGLPVNQAGSEQQSQPTPNLQQQQQKQQHHQNDEGKPMDAIDRIKTELFDLLQKITAFDGLSAKSKEYLYLDEMLTRCTLKLDNIDDPELRLKRKAAIKLIDQATDILQRKLKINLDIHDLSRNMTS